MNNRVFIVFIVSLLFGVFGCTYSKRNVPFTQAPAPQMIHNVDVKMKHEIVKDLDTESCGKFFWLFPTPLAFTFGDFGISHPLLIQCPLRTNLLLINQLMKIQMPYLFKEKHMTLLRYYHFTLKIV